MLIMLILLYEIYMYISIYWGEYSFAGAGESGKSTIVKQMK